MKAQRLLFNFSPVLVALLAAAVFTCWMGQERAHAAPVDEWHKVFDRPFSATSGSNRVLALAEFKGGLYAGVGSSASGRVGASVFRLVDEGCQIWQDVTPPWSPKTSGDSMAMLVFNNHLYVGTDQGQVLRTVDGKNWSNVTGSLSIMGIEDMAAFNGQIYVAAGRIAKYAEIWRTSNSTSVPHGWQPVVGPSPALHSAAFGVSATKYPLAGMESLEVFNGYLYAGLGLDDNNGIQLWRTTNGKNWGKFKEVYYPPPWVAAPPGHAHALKAFQGYLYVGEYHGQGLYRTDGSPKSWDYIPNAIPSGDVFRMEEHDGKLYIGVSLMWLSGASPLVHFSPNGTTWTAVPGSPVRNPATDMITAMVSYGGRLYVGIDNPSASGHVAIYRYGAPGPYCMVELAHPCPFESPFWWLCEPRIDPALLEMVPVDETVDGREPEIVEGGADERGESDVREGTYVMEPETVPATCEEHPAPR